MNKDELRQYRYLQQEIQLLTDEIATLRERSLLAHNWENGIQSNHRSDLTMEAALKAVEVQERLCLRVREMLQLRQEIEECIISLPIEQRLLLRLRYIEGQKWESIALSLNYSYRQVHRIHGRILQKLTRTQPKEGTK